MIITLFIPCFVDLMYPQVGISMVRIFEKLGHKVVAPEGARNPGAPIDLANCPLEDEKQGGLMPHEFSSNS